MLGAQALQETRPIAPDHPALLALPPFIGGKEDPEQQDRRQKQYQEILDHSPKCVLDRRENLASAVEERMQQIYDQRVDMNSDFQVVSVVSPVPAEYLIVR